MTSLVDHYPAAELPVSLVAPILQNPPDFPGWPLNRWRQLLGRGRLPAALPGALSDSRLVPLLAWVTENTNPKRRLGAIAAVLAVLDRAVHDDAVEPDEAAEWVRSATNTARPLRSRRATQAHTSPSPGLDDGPDRALASTEASKHPPFGEMGVMLLRHVGLDPRGDLVFVRRLAACLDVAVSHWLEGAVPGNGLPEFRSEHRRFYRDRLIVKLGADRDLLRLLRGPQPGRGRDRQAAWERGLTFWTAQAWAANVRQEPIPAVPPQVVAQWRKELAALTDVPEPGVEGAVDSRYEATA